MKEACGTFIPLFKQALSARKMAGYKIATKTGGQKWPAATQEGWYFETQGRPSQQKQIQGLNPPNAGQCTFDQYGFYLWCTGWRASLSLPQPEIPENIYFKEKEKQFCLP